MNALIELFRLGIALTIGVAAFAAGVTLVLTALVYLFIGICHLTGFA